MADLFALGDCRNRDITVVHRDSSDGHMYSFCPTCGRNDCTNCFYDKLTEAVKPLYKHDKLICYVERQDRKARNRFRMKITQRKTGALVVMLADNWRAILTRPSVRLDVKPVDPNTAVSRLFDTITDHYDRRIQWIGAWSAPEKIPTGVTFTFEAGRKYVNKALRQAPADLDLTDPEQFAAIMAKAKVLQAKAEAEAMKRSKKPQTPEATKPDLMIPESDPRTDSQP